MLPRVVASVRGPTPKENLVGRGCHPPARQAWQHLKANPIATSIKYFIPHPELRQYAAGQIGHRTVLIFGYASGVVVAVLIVLAFALRLESLWLLGAGFLLAGLYVAVQELWNLRSRRVWWFSTRPYSARSSALMTSRRLGVLTAGEKLPRLPLHVGYFDLQLLEFSRLVALP